MIATTFDSTDLTDLQRFSDDSSGPYLSVIVPARSGVTDAAQRLEDLWQRVKNDVGDRWPVAALDQAESAVRAAGHALGDSLAVIVPTSGSPLVEHLVGSPASTRTLEGALPALTPIIEHRQRTVPHIVVDCDKSGADMTAFDGGTVLATDSVEGSELHIHRGHPGGWSQSRFQQRAENTWEENIDDVADAVQHLANQVDAQLIAVAGPTRAKSTLVKELNERSLGAVTKALDAGDIAGVADETIRLADDVYARTITAISEEFRERNAHGTATASRAEVLKALQEGRVESLLVADNWSDTTPLDVPLDGVPSDARAIDGAIAAAMSSGASITIVPRLAALEGSLGAFLRW